MAVAKELRAQRASLITEAEALNAKPTLSGEEETRLEAIFGEVDKLWARIQQTERLEVLAADLREHRAEVAERTGRSHDEVADAAEHEKKLIKAWMRRNFAGLTDADKAALSKRTSNDPNYQGAASVGTPSAGGYTVAQAFSNELAIAMKALGGVRGVARVVVTETGADMPWPTLDDTANVASIVAENTAGAAGTDLAFGSVTMKAWMYRSGYLPISLELLQDGAFDFDTLIRDTLAWRFARGENAHFTTGNGSSQPSGIATGGVLGKTGTTGQTTSVIYDDLVDLVHSVDSAYRSGSVFMMNDQSIKVIRKLKDSANQPIWVEDKDTGISGGIPGTLLGYPVVINQDVATMAANAKSIFFGNFRQYLIRDVMGLRITRLDERFAENGQVAFLGFKRVDGRIVSGGAPIKWYANSAT